MSDSAAAYRGRLRSAVAVVLLVFVVLLAPLSVVARWFHTHIADTGGYVATVAPLARNADIHTALANAAAAAVTQHVDVPAIGTLVSGATRRFAESDAFPPLWLAANREAHRQVLGVFTGHGTDQVAVEGGRVSLDVGGMVAGARQRLLDDGVSAAALIPSVDLSITIFESDRIAPAQRVFRLLDQASAILPVLTAVLFAGAIAVARRRLRTAAVAAACVAMGMALLAAALALVRSQYLAALPGDIPTPVARAVFDALAAPLWPALRDWLIAALGSAVVLAAAWIGWTRFTSHRTPAAPAGAAAIPQE
ncbi:MAG: hypothetical protein FWD85_10440 [Microbacteriaceae bacterium]|nr:hypothetical protein [Microbacteriaceae bacterium]MCL2795714.1 hypothetical protein [Microbacteriaceae bacterium]